MADPAALSNAAHAHAARAAALVGLPTPARSIPPLGKVAAAVADHPEARAEWAAAVALWWRLALTEQRMALAMARRYRTPDARQEAMIGLFRGAQTFDPAKGGFRMHVRGWVRAQLIRSDAEDRPIRINSNALNLLMQGAKAKNEARKRGENPNAAKVGRSYHAARAARDGVVSTEASLQDSDGLLLGDALAAPEFEPDRMIDADRIRAWVAALPERERLIVHAVYAENQTFEEARNVIGGPCRKTARKVHDQALARLRAEAA